MNKALRGTLKVSGIVLGTAAVLAVVAALLVVFDKPLVRSVLRRQLAKGAGLTARFDRLDYTVFPLRVTLAGLEFGREDVFQKLGGTLARVEARGSFWKILRGARPAIDTIVIDGLSFDLRQKASSEEPLDIEKILMQASDALAWARTISFTNARLSIALLSGTTELENLDLALTPGPSRDVIAYAITRGDLRVRDKAGAPVFSAGLASSGDLGLVSPMTIDIAFDLRTVRFKAAGLEDSLEALSLAATARFDKTAQELTVSRLKLAAPGLLDLEGTMGGKLGHGLFLEASAEARCESLAAAAALARPLLPAGLVAAAPRGRAVLAGKYLVQRSETGTKDNLAADLSLEDVELDPVVEGKPLHVRAAGRVSAAGPSVDPRLTADVRLTTGPWASSGLAFEGSEIHIAGSAGKTAVDVSRLDITASRPAYEPAPGKRLAVDRATLSGRGTFDLARGEGVLTALDVRLGGLAPIRLSGRYGSAKSASSEIRIDARGLDVAALRTLAGPFVPAGFAGWDLGGALDLAFSVRRSGRARDDWRVSGTAGLTGAKFSDPSFTVAGEGLDPVLAFEGAGSRAKGLSFSASLDLARGESLWKSVYVAWAKRPLKLTASGRYDPGSGAVDTIKARLTLPEVGSIDVDGTARLGPSPSFDLTAASSLSLGPLYSLYTQAGVAEEARLKLEGTLGARLLVRKTAGALSVGGRLTIADANIEDPKAKTFVRGVAADLPFLYESGPAAVPVPDAPLTESGHLRIGEFRDPLLTLGPLEIGVRAGANALAIEPVGVDLFGGRLELGRTTFRLEPATGAFNGLGSLALRDLDISKFPIQSPEFKLTGTVQADFPRLDIGADRIAIAGRGEARVFGGTIVLRDLAVADPFSAGRSISLDVDLVDLDMKKLTDEVPFGEVTGIVRGEIRGLVITYGQPERFSFRIESVPRKGVAQTFSLKAVDNLTVISSGQTASGGTGSFWMRFIRGFRYEKLGIVSTLRNDTFTLNGTIHEGGVEYLVKKPALFGISVVNREPGKKISFREMTSRLKRVGQSGG